MTWSEAKDQIAKKWGLKDFESLSKQGRPFLDNMDSFYGKAAELYSRQVAKDFWEASWAHLNNDAPVEERPDFEQFSKEYFK